MRYTLGKALEKRSNNLQVIKFMAAIAVIICHAFALTGCMEKEWMYILTKGQMDFGMLAVSIFFLTGGVLIARSVEKSKSLLCFLQARCVRILPLLQIVVILTIIFGTVFTQLPLKDYFFSSRTWRYLLNGILILQHTLPGVFDNNIYGNTVNGSLWTLPVEFLCYIACFVVYKIKCLNKKGIIWVIAAYLLFAVVGTILLTAVNQQLLIAAIQPCWLFLLGMFYYVWRDRIILDFRLFLVSMLLMICSFAMSFTYLAIWVFLPYVIIYLAFMELQCGAKISKPGDYSYAIYLCAFPIQQAFVSCYESAGPVFNMCVSVFVAVFAGAVLYYFVEKPVTERLLSKNL